MSNADQLIWIRSQSKLESHQRERTVAYLAVAGKNLVSSRLFFLAERVPLDVLAKEKKNIDGMTHVIGEGQTQEKGKNGEWNGDTKSNVKTNVAYTVRLFAVAFVDRCLEQMKAKHYAQTAQIKKTRKKKHENMHETAAEPVMHVVVQAELSPNASDLFTAIVKDKGCVVSHTVPIYEGYSLPNVFLRLDLVDHDLTENPQVLLPKP